MFYFGLLSFLKTYSQHSAPGKVREARESLRKFHVLLFANTDFPFHYCYCYHSYFAVIKLVFRIKNSHYYYCWDFPIALHQRTRFPLFSNSRATFSAKSFSSHRSELSLQIKRALRGAIFVVMETRAWIGRTEEKSDKKCSSAAILRRGSVSIWEVAVQRKGTGRTF